MTLIRTDYRAVNRRGRTLYTFSDRDLGREWVRKHQHLHDGLKLERVETVEVARTDYRPRPVRKAPDFSFPAMTGVGV